MTKLDVSKGNLRANLRLQLMRMQTEQEEKKMEQTPAYSQSYRPTQTAPQSIQIPAGSISSSTEVPTKVLTVSTPNTVRHGYSKHAYNELRLTAKPFSFPL